MPHTWNMSQDIIIQTLVKNIKKLRTERNLRCEELSLLLGLSRSYISNLERGKVTLRIRELLLIADYFDVSVSELLKFH